MNPNCGHTFYIKIGKEIGVILIFFILIYKFEASGQNNPKGDIEKLKQELKIASAENKVNVLLSLCYQFFSYSSDSAFFYAEQALKLSEQLKNDTLIGRSYLMIGHSYLMIGNDSMSFLSLTRSADIFKKNNDSSNLANILLAIGQYYYYKGDYPNSLQYYFVSLGIYKAMDKPQSYDNVILLLVRIGDVFIDKKNYKQALNYYHYALKLAERFNDNGTKVSTIYSSIGSIYMDWKQYRLAIEYYFESYSISRVTGNMLNVAGSMNDLGLAYFELKSFDTAFYYLNKADELYSDLNEKHGLSAVKQLLGNYYREMKNYYAALRYYKGALLVCNQTKEELRVSSLYHEIGKLYYLMGLYNLALNNCKSSLALAEKIGDKENIYQNYFLLSDIYSAMDSCSNAFYYYQQYVAKKDSIFTKDIYQQFSDIQEKYETVKKEKTIQNQKQTVEIQKINIRRQKIFRNSSLIVTILFAALVFVALRSNKQKRMANLIIAAEKDRSDKLLMNILPEETAEELKREGFAKTRYYELVSVLFTDFKGFTALAEKMAPEQLVAELDYCFKAYDAIVEKYHVEKIKTIGDSYMCAGGLPVANTTNPADVVKCGIEICVFMQEYKKKRMALNEPYFEVRIGVHTGPVISGIVGTKKFAYDIWGDTVNTASRMESSGILGSVNISGGTYQYIKNDFKCTYRGKIEAKNKGVIDMYLVECCLAEMKGEE